MKGPLASHLSVGPLISPPVSAGPVTTETLGLGRGAEQLVVIVALLFTEDASPRVAWSGPRRGRR